MTSSGQAPQQGATDPCPGSLKVRKYHLALLQLLGGLLRFALLLLLVVLPCMPQLATCAHARALAERACQQSVCRLSEHASSASRALGLAPDLRNKRSARGSRPLGAPRGRGAISSSVRRGRAPAAP